MLGKFGFIGKINKPDLIWIQAVSVGEINLIGSLIRKLKEVSNYPLVISTTTLTGNRIAREKYQSEATIIFFPFDISFVLEKVVRIIKPKIFISVETEIWPNLFWRLNQKKVPIVIVNGRISDKAFRGYLCIKPVIERVVNKCSYIGVQNQAYKEKFLKLGAQEEKIAISGNMKFESILVDQARLKETKKKYIPILKKGNNLLLVAGSTHSPEEEAIIDAYKSICQEGTNLTLLLAPRHPERLPSLEKLISSQGFNPVSLSQINNSQLSKKDIFLVDRIGELFYFYSLADVCFVGGSLFKGGGQNILEPIYFLKPTVFGPHMDNFQDIEEIVLEKAAGIKLKNPQELKMVLSGLIKDQALRLNLRNKCLSVFEEEKKSLEKNLDLILKCLN
jgi:3-deoxy-D-manno-octulosonic-acid transferase